MDADNLIRMANRIGDFFQAIPDREEALAGITEHLRKFWEPRMRRQLYAAIDAGHASDLHEIIRAAVDRNRAMLEPAAP
jgi:formate dehydrogenase subunit delta